MPLDAPHLPDLLRAALEDPPATGVLVLTAEDPVRRGGLEPGVVITEVDGHPVQDTAAVAALAGASSAGVPATLRRADEDVPVVLPEDLSGFHTIGVQAGVAVPVRPDEVAAVVDPGALGGERELWFRFLAGGPIGCEHHRIRVDGAAVEIDSEVAFDSPAWGVHHTVVSERLEVRDGRLRPVEAVFEQPLLGRRVEGRLDDGPAGPVWRATITEPDGTRETVEPLAVDACLEHAVHLLPLLLPVEGGWCVHVTPVFEGSGRVAWPGFPIALVGAGADVVEVLGEPVPAARVETLALGQVQARLWVTEDRCLARIDYGGAQAVAATRDEALDLTPADARLRLG